MGLNQQQFAILLDVSSSSISLVERGEAPPPFEALVKLACEHPSVDLRHLLCGVSQAESLDASLVADLVRPVIRPLTDNLHDLPPEGVADDYRAVPLVDGRVAAGPGAVVWERVLSLVWVYKPELGRRKNLVAVRVMGDSMHPTIPDGAIIIIDKDSRQPVGRRRCIWALRTEEGDIQIKRLYKHVPPHGDKNPETWWLLSDNFQVFPPELVWTADFDRLVLGQVVWMWQSLV